MNNASAGGAFSPSGTNTILVAYFSHSGNTREVARQIHKIAGGELFEIQAVKPYPRDYDAVVQQARKELDSGDKPTLKTRLEDIKPYALVCIGYPNWWGTLPRPIVTFLSEHDLSGKTIAPFCTHEGSGLGRSATDLSKLCPRSTVVGGLAIRGSDVKNAQNKISAWLNSICR